MTQFNHQTTTLSEQGMPGDVVTQVVPVDGSRMGHDAQWHVVFFNVAGGPFFRIRDVPVSMIPW